MRPSAGALIGGQLTGKHPTKLAELGRRSQGQRGIN